MESESPQPLDTHPNPQKPRWRIRCGRCLALLLALALVTEIILRTVFGLAHPLLYQADAACGYLPQPHQDIVRFFRRNTINDQSMRSPDFAAMPPVNTVRLLCIGDSVTYGTTYLPQDQIFTTRLATMLPGMLHSNVEVLNASAGGWAPGNEWGFLKSRGTFNANLVLFIWNTPDIGQPFASFMPNPSMPTQRPYTAIGEAWSRYVMPRIFHGAAAPPDPGSTPGTGSDPVQVAANLQMLADAKEFAAKAGAKFGVVYVPSPADGWQTPAFENDRVQLTQYAAGHQISLLDLTGAFKTHGWMSLSLDGIHLKPEGHKVVADEIAGHWDLLVHEAGK